MAYWDGIPPEIIRGRIADSMALARTIARIVDAAYQFSNPHVTTPPIMDLVTEALIESANEFGVEVSRYLLIIAQCAIWTGEVPSKQEINFPLWPAGGEAGR